MLIEREDNVKSREYALAENIRQFERQSEIERWTYIKEKREAKLPGKPNDAIDTNVVAKYAAIFILSFIVLMII